jgi:hydrogenase maturation protease
MLQDVRVLVAGVGNVLRGDDGFGVVAAQRLLAEPLPPEVQVLDVGIGGIHLVQELLDPVDALVIIDATELGRRPGAVAILRPDVRDPSGPDDLADMHYATPERALMLARALNVLPERVWIVGCQPDDAERLGDDLSPAAAAAVDPAIAEVRRLVARVLESA